MESMINVFKVSVKLYGFLTFFPRLFEIKAVKIICVHLYDMHYHPYLLSSLSSQTRWGFEALDSSDASILLVVEKGNRY
jgi:hypothetical protein